MKKINKFVPNGITKGFTLVELLVVIAIVAVLAAVVVLIVNPLELTKRSRDAARLSDLANLQQAINLAMQEGTGAASQKWPACNSDAATDPGACSGKSTDSNARGTTGGGWVKVTFANQSNVTVPTLPVDPTNTLAMHYTYCGSGSKWIIKTALESEKEKPRMSNDGDSDNTSYAVGSDMTLACTY